MDHHDEHESGQEGLGTQTGANEAGSQNPDHSPGATPEGQTTGGGQSPQSDDAPDNPVGTENPDADDSTTYAGTPQDGEVDEDADMARGSTDNRGVEPPDTVEGNMTLEGEGRD